MGKKHRRMNAFLEDPMTAMEAEGLTMQDFNAYYEWKQQAELQQKLQELHDLQRLLHEQRTLAVPIITISPYTEKEMKKLTKTKLYKLVVE